MRKLNVRLLVVLIVCLLVGGGAVHGLHWFQVRRLAKRFSGEAERAAREEEYDEAAGHLTRCVLLRPRQIDAYGQLADLLRRRLGRVDEADYWIDRLVHLNPNSHRARVLRGRYLIGEGRIEQAEADAVQALELAPDDREALVVAAQCALAKGEHAQAREHARRAVELHPRSADGYLALADAEARAGRWKAAVDCLRQGAKSTVGNEILLSSLATVLLDQGHLDEAQELVTTLATDRQGAVLAGYLQARIDYSEGRWRSASRGFEQARTRLSMRPDLAKQVELWLGECYGQMGNSQLQLSACQRAAQIDPAWAPARMGIASVLLAAGRVNEALVQLRGLAELPGAPPNSLVELARVLIVKNLTLPPAERNWQEVEETLNRAAPRMPESDEIPRLRAQALVAQDRLPEAEKLLEQARAANPKQVELWIALAALADRKGDGQRAADLIDEAEKELGDSVPLRLARAARLLRSGAEGAADSLRALADDAEQFPEPDRARLRRGLASLSLSVGDPGQAEQLYRQVADAEPNDLRVRLVLLDLAVRARDIPGMAPILDELRRIEGEGPFWHYGSARYFRLLAEEGVNEAEFRNRAREHLARAEELRPGWSRLPLLAAEIHHLEGDDDAAIRDYLRAIELGERGAQAVRGALNLMYREQRYADADQLIRRLEQEEATFTGELGRMASDLSMRLDDADRALEIARRLADESNDYRNHLWLAQVLEVLGRRAENEQKTGQSQALLAEAEQVLRKSVELAPTVPLTWVALLRFLRRMERTDEVSRVIAEIPEKVPGQRAALVLAQCHEAIGQLDEAQKQCQAALAAAPDDPAVLAWAADFFLRTGKPPLAEEQLERIATGRLQAGENAVIAARRKLAPLLAAHGNFADLERAIDLVDDNLAATGASVVDRHLKAVLLASHPRRTRRKEAVQIFEDIFDRRWSPTPQDRFLLAQLYSAEGDWPKAAGQLELLADSPQTEPRYLAAYVEALLRLEQPAQAEPPLARLETAAPNEFPTVRLRAEALLERGQVDQAIRLLRKYLEQSGSESPDEATRLELVAAYLQDLARRLNAAGEANLASRLLAEAEAIRRAYVDRYPAQEILIASILEQQGRLDEAVRLVDQAHNRAEPAAIARVVGSLLANDAVSQQQIERMATVLDEACAKHDRPVSLLLALANLRISQQRYDEAEKLLRETMEKSPNVVALNNLAVLLALQKTDLDEARDLIEKAVKAAGPIPTLLDSRATVYLALGNQARALADLEAAIADDPDPIWYFHKAQVHHQAGQRQAALGALAKAGELGLAPERLSPLERQAYHELQDALKEKQPSPD